MVKNPLISDSMVRPTKGAKNGHLGAGRGDLSSKRERCAHMGDQTGSKSVHHRGVASMCVTHRVRNM